MIIGITGKARAGKDEAAKYLMGAHGFIRMAFADALKAACREIFGLTDAQLHGDDKDRADLFWGDTPRNILQKVGTECLRRGYRPDVWIKALERKVANLPKKLVRGGGACGYAAPDVVVSDVRFPNEADAIREWGGKVVRIMRPGGSRIFTAQHASEVSMDDYQADHVILNDRSLSDLHGRIENMLEALR